MKWDSNIRATKEGTIRKAQGFLFFPKKIGTLTRWLEYAEWTEQLIFSIRHGYKWEGVEWTDNKCPTCGRQMKPGYRSGSAIVDPMCEVPHPITQIPRTSN